MHDADDGDSDDNVGQLGLEEQYCKQATVFTQYS